MELEGFTNAAELLGPGIYVLRFRGKVVYIGRARGPMLEKIAAWRGDRPKFLPRIIFDEILIRFVHPDRINAVYDELISLHQPRHNPAPVRSQIILERRI